MPRAVVVDDRGAQHGSGSLRTYDDRTRTLESAGFQVVRFTNEEVREDLEGVLRKLGEALRLPFD